MSISRTLFNFFERIFFLIHKILLHFKLIFLPSHYYVGTNDILKLNKSKREWVKRNSFIGVNINLEEQIKNLKKICIQYKDEYKGNNFYKEATNKNFGPGYGYIEAQALHAVIRYYKPKKVIEVGSGVSTYCIYKACEINRSKTGINAEIISVEPNPSKFLKNFSSVKLIQKDVQKVNINLFKNLQDRDLLFIDSSHTVKTGGDVNKIILEILPVLNPGVIIHFHDIFFPYDYQRNVLFTYCVWSETSLLHAFLKFNKRFQIIFCLSQLHYDKTKELKKIFPDYIPQSNYYGLIEKNTNLSNHFPASIYLIVKD